MYIESILNVNDENVISSLQKMLMKCMYFQGTAG